MGQGKEAPDERPKAFSDAIPTPSLNDFQNGAKIYFNSLEERQHAHEDAVRANPKLKLRRNSMGNYWSNYGLPSGGQQTNLTSFEPMAANIQFAPLTLQWLTLMYSYTTYGILQRIIDVPVYDAFRGGLEIESAGNEMNYRDIEALDESLEEQGILEAMRDGNIWADLFGGGALIFNSEGEDYSKPLDIERLGRAPIEIYDASRWELGSESRIPVSGFYDFYGLRVHASRVMTICGKRAPFLIRDQLAGWGLAKIQRLSEDFNGYLRTKNAKFELMLEAKVDVFRIKNYKNQLASPMASQLTQRRIALVNRFKSFNNAMLLDSEDEYQQKQISFSGIAEMAKENRMDIAEAAHMPMSKIWGIGSTGLSSGEDDLENYNAEVESVIREPNRPRVRRVLDMAIRALFGTEFKFKFKYKPLRVLSSVDEETIKKSETERISLNLQMGLITPKQAIEWQQKKGLIPIAIETSSFEGLSGAPMNPDQEASEELRELGQTHEKPGDDPGAAREHPRLGQEHGEGGGVQSGGRLEGYSKTGTEPPPIGFSGARGMDAGRAAEVAGVTGAGGSSSAVPWPGPQRQLKGANEVKGPGKTPEHPQRVEKAGQ
jgi:phage-related protein (TIGR01555 family)